MTEAQWKTMSATDFASYKAIILGDPNIMPSSASTVNTAGEGATRKAVVHPAHSALVLA